MHSYDIELLLDEPRSEVFRSRSTIRFSCARPSAYADLAASAVESAVLNGRPLDIAQAWDGARLRLTGLEAVNKLEVEGVFGFAVSGRGLRRASDPDGTGYVYGIHYPDAASRVFCCFDDPKLRARIDLRISAPTGWTSLTNGTAARLAPYLVAGAAGPWARLHQRTASAEVPLAVYAQRARSGEQDLGRRIAELLAESIAWCEQALGVPYPYEKCDAVFVRDLPPLALSTPGLILFADRAFDRLETRQYAVTVLCHEVAHSWLGGLVDCAGHPWLVEAAATYLARTAVLDLVPGARPWDMDDPPAPDAGYAEDAELIRSVEDTIGREPVLRGLGEYCRRFAGGNAGPVELAAFWSELGGRDVTDWSFNRNR
ncbi:MAG TPA: M1 family aminopeptidase [Pseudonocardiaceae bacterium]|nr:M1 family aminopeptidase [Pseudonocardiaceae bacterium]